MATTTTSIPTLPGVTEEQVREAMDIAARVAAEYAVPAEIEAEVDSDPEIRDSKHVAVMVWAAATPEAGWIPFIGAIGAALEAAGLEEPAVPMRAHVSVRH
jgi:hypothetical protein